MATDFTCNKLAINLTAALLWAAVSCVFAQGLTVAVSPARLELTAAPGQTVTETIAVINSTAEDRAVTVETEDWLMDSVGQATFVAPGTTPFSATSWLTVEEAAFLLPTESERDFRVSVTVPDTPDLAGTYQTAVFFKTAAPPKEGGQVNVAVAARVGVIVYVHVAGTEQVAVDLLDFYQAEAALSLLAINDGNTSVRLGGTVELRNEGGEVAYTLEIPDVALLRESERELSLPLPEDIAPGFYVALALLEDSRGGRVVGELPFNVP